MDRPVSVTRPKYLVLLPFEPLPDSGASDYSLAVSVSSPAKGQRQQKLHSEHPDITHAVLRGLS